MAARRPSSACYFCQSRHSLTGRRRLHLSARKRMEAVALRPEDDGFVMNDRAQGNTESERNGREEQILSMADTMRQWRLHSGVDEIREKLLGFESLVKRRDMRLEVLRNLSNPWPIFQQEHAHKMHAASKVDLNLPEARAAPVPHAVFRQSIKTTMGDKAIRQIIRVQLLRCEWPKEILRVIAVAMQSRTTAVHVATLYEPIMRALYRCRNHVSDPEVLTTINTIVSRFLIAGLGPNEQLINMGLKFAARARSLNSMKRCLRLFREQNLQMSSNLFRSVVAKFSIGHRGLGEIRNGRWRKADLMQVLTGFEDCQGLPADQQYHLGTFLQRDDWQFLHGWIAVLARCKASDLLWQEWELWKQSEARLTPKKLKRIGGTMNSRLRGDSWFVEQMSVSGDQPRAWMILQETDIPFSRLKPMVKRNMLDYVEHAGVWTDQIRDAMLEKYDTELAQIEKAFGVVWESGGEDGEGRHLLLGDQEEALEELGASDFTRAVDYGFPYEASPMVPEQERLLHDAKEGGLAEHTASGRRPVHSR